jgi:hypothetical protein
VFKTAADTVLVQAQATTDSRLSKRELLVAEIGDDLQAPRRVRNTAVVADIAYLAVLGKVPCHDLIAVQTDPDDADLSAGSSPTRQVSDQPDWFAAGPNRRE